MSEGWVILGAMKKPSGQATAQFRKQQLVDGIDSLELSAGQQQIVDLPLGSVALAVGWPGSGKTTALKAHFLRLARKTSPEEILVIAANRTAAAKLRDELALAFQGSTLGPTARTLSSIAFSVLRFRALEQGLKLPELVSGSEQDVILSELVELIDQGVLPTPNFPKRITTTVLGLSGFRNELRDLIAVAIEHSISPVQLAKLGLDKQKPEWVGVSEIYAHYLSELEKPQNSHRFDPSALLVEAAKVVREGIVPNDLLKNVKHILVDDAQELTPAAVQLLGALTELGAGLVLFGDPDVSTLGFRAADPEAMHRFADSLAKQRGTELVQTYIYPTHASHPADVSESIARITPRIPVAKAGPQRQGMKPAASVNAEPSIEAAVFGLQQEEAGWLANRLRTLHLNDGIAFKDMAVVARSRDELEELENALAAESVPVRIVGAQSALRDEFGAVSYLRLAQQVLSSEPVSVENAISLLMSPVAGFDAITLRRLRRILRKQELESGSSRSSGELIAELFTAPGSAATLPGDGKRADRFIELFFALREIAADETKTIEDLLWHAWVKSAPSKVWPQLSRGIEEVALQANRNLDSVVALFSAAARFVERNPTADGAEFVEQQLAMALPEDSLSVATNLNQAVSLLTPSALISKRFRVVALAHMQEGIWPNLKPRSSLLGAAALNQLQRDPSFDTNSENRSELAAELRMLYKAVGSTTERLLVSAIDTEEEQVSQFVRLIVGRDIETGEFIQTRLTLRGMVGQLRRQLLLANDEGQRQQLAIQLARLAAESVPGAHPDYWYGLRELSTTEALAELHVAEDHENRLELHPSELDNFVKCPLHWFIEAHGGREASMTAKIGTLIHEILEQATEFSEEAFKQAVDSKWHNLEFESEWERSAERRRVSKMIVRLLTYLDDVRIGKRRVIAVEEKIDFALAGAWVNGKADRIEIDDQSNVTIADLKTSRTEVSESTTDGHLQLAVYQLAALNGGFKHVGALEAQPNGVGAVLVQIGHKKKDKDLEPIVTSQTALKVEGVQVVAAIDQFLAQVEKITEGMLLVDAEVAANTGLHCYERNPYGSCSLHLIEQVSYGE